MEKSDFFEGGYYIRMERGGSYYYLEDINLAGQVMWTKRGVDGFWFGSIGDAYQFIEDELGGREVEVVSEGVVKRGN